MEKLEEYILKTFDELKHNAIAGNFGVAVLNYRMLWYLLKKHNINIIDPEEITSTNILLDYLPVIFHGIVEFIMLRESQKIELITEKLDDWNINVEVSFIDK